MKFEKGLRTNNILFVITTYFHIPSKLIWPDEFTGDVKISSDNKQNIVCPQSLFKFHPDFDEIIGGVLRVLPNANIQIIDGSYKFWGALIKERMLKNLSDVSDRIEILPRLSIDQISELMGVATPINSEI